MVAAARFARLGRRLRRSEPHLGPEWAEDRLAMEQLSLCVGPEYGAAVYRLPPGHEALLSVLRKSLR